MWTSCLASWLALLTIIDLSSTASPAERKTLLSGKNQSSVAMDIFPDITDLGDDGGRSVTIFVDPPLNYTAVVGGYWLGTDQLTKIDILNGEWRHGLARGPMEPFSNYNITVFNGDNKQVAFETFMTDVGTPETDVLVWVDAVSTTTAIIYAQPRSRALLHGPPTGYRVKLCPVNPVANSTRCVHHSCTIMPCVLYNLERAVSYNVSMWAFNTGFWQENRENRSLQTVFKVSTRSHTRTHRQFPRVWIVAIALPIVASIGLGVMMIICRLRHDRPESV